MSGWQLGEHPREQFVPKYPSLQAKNKVKNIPIISKKSYTKNNKEKHKTSINFHSLFGLRLCRVRWKF